MLALPSLISSTFLTSNVMLPLSGLLIALFVGYVMKEQFVDDEMQGTPPLVMKLWRFTLRYIAPVAISRCL